MRASLLTELSKNNPASPSKRYAIPVNILQYAPGNAFTRWLVPGAGATKLSVDAIILDQGGKQRARIPVQRSIAAGGGYTIGAWKYVFDEVAAEIVSLLKNADKRTPPKQK